MTPQRKHLHSTTGAAEWQKVRAGLVTRNNKRGLEIAAAVADQERWDTCMDKMASEVIDLTQDDKTHAEVDLTQEDDEEMLVPRSVRHFQGFTQVEVDSVTKALNGFRRSRKCSKQQMEELLAIPISALPVTALRADLKKTIVMALPQRKGWVYSAILDMVRRRFIPCAKALHIPIDVMVYLLVQYGDLIEVKQWKMLCDCVMDDPAIPSDLRQNAMAPYGAVDWLRGRLRYIKILHKARHEANSEHEWSEKEVAELESLCYFWFITKRSTTSDVNNFMELYDPKWIDWYGAGKFHSTRSVVECDEFYRTHYN
jgi:hypothetical protein